MNERLKKIVTADELHANSFYDGIYYEYPKVGLVQVFEAYVPIKKREANLEPDKPKKKRHYRAENNPSDSDDAVQRAKSTVRKLALINTFELLATFTFKSDRQDIQKCMRRMRDWLKNQQRRNGKFRYIVVPEFHADGVSLHFHGLLAGYAGRVKEAVNSDTGKLVFVRGKQQYSISGWRLGFSNAEILGTTQQERSKTPAYVTKYFTKGMPKLFGKKRYWTSHDLERPEKHYGLPTWYRDREPIWSKSLEFGKLSYFLIEQLGTTSADLGNEPKHGTGQNS